MQQDDKQPENAPRPGGAPVDRTTSPNAPARPRSLTGMVVLLPILLIGGAVWLTRGGSGPEGTSSAFVPTGTPAPTGEPSASPTPTAPPSSGTYVVYLPTADGTLKRKEIAMPRVPVVKRDPDTKRGLWADLTLGALFNEGAEYFPKGTHPAGPSRASKDVITVDMNQAYLTNAESWSSAEATMRVMSIVNSVAATDAEITGQLPSVQILVEGKTVTTIGPMDAATPIPPDATVPAP